MIKEYVFILYIGSIIFENKDKDSKEIWIMNDELDA